MSIFNRIFNSTKIDCPRCLGKGEVDINDIKRLKMELRWRTGPCAYCNGSGKVPSSMPSKVSADCAYLTTDLPKAERKKLIGDVEAIKRGTAFEMRVNSFIREIEYLYSTGMDRDKDPCLLYDLRTCSRR